MTWMVTGGAGYIGAHVVRAFEKAGIAAVVIDDLSSGHREFVGDQTPFVEGSILDTDLVASAIAEHDVTGVVVLVQVRRGEQSLLVDEDGPADPVVAGQLPGVLDRRADDLTRARRPLLDRGRGSHPAAGDEAVISGCNVCMAEHAWQRAHPAAT